MQAEAVEPFCHQFFVQRPKPAPSLSPKEKNDPAVPEQSRGRWPLFYQRIVQLCRLTAACVRPFLAVQLREL